MTMNKSLETKQLILLPGDRETLEKAIRGNGPLEKHLNVQVPDSWTEFGVRALQYSLNKILENEQEAGWWTYLPIHKADQKLIGSCGFKGSPNEEGIVEIGYEIMKPYRNKGLATELAQALVEHAFSYDQVKAVQAHTLGEVNASTHVLSKCGFSKVTELDDADNGKIWKWELIKRN